MKKNVMKTLLVACGLAFSTDVLANDVSGKEFRELFGKGEDACKKEDYYSALSFYEKAENIAQEKDKKFMAKYLADMYESGKCLNAYTQQGTPNYAKAVEWYHRAINAKSNPDGLFDDQHHYNAMFSLARIYFFGQDGVERDVAMARHLLEKIDNMPDEPVKERTDKGEITLRAASLMEVRGNARLMLAQMHYYGDFARQDYALAYQWADKGRQDVNGYAVELLAVLLYNGWGTQQNKTEATRLMGAVCDSGDSQDACNWYKEMKANRPIRY